MTEHRPVLDPSILDRMANSMSSIKDAWDEDVIELRRTKQELADTAAALAVANERLRETQTDLAQSRRENEALIRRNAHLDAHIEKLTENTMDARDILGGLAVRAAESVRAPIPATPAAVASPDLVDDDDDGTGLPAGLPEFVRRPNLTMGERRTVIPVNEFAPRRAMAAE